MLLKKYKCFVFIALKDGTNKWAIKKKHSRNLGKYATSRYFFLIADRFLSKHLQVGYTHNF